MVTRMSIGVPFCRRDKGMFMCLLERSNKEENDR